MNEETADAGATEPRRHPDDLVSLRDAEPGVFVPPTGGAGDVVVRADLVGTVLFTVTAALAAVLFTTTWQWIAAITVLVLFAAGIFAFLWAYYNAVQRSRTEEITVTQLYLLFGPAIPSGIRRTMLGALGVQAVVALVTAFARLNGPDGNPGSSLALGFLVPMFGFGMNGLWAAYHGDFSPRATKPVPKRVEEEVADAGQARESSTEPEQGVEPGAEPVTEARQAREASSEPGGERSSPEQGVEPAAEPVTEAWQAREASSEPGGERSSPEERSVPE